MPITLIDFGHGENTPGKRAGDLLEWEFNRRVGKFLTYELNCSRIPYHILVPEDTDIPLRIRSLRANNYAKENGSCILLSIHGNAFKDESVEGIETWYHSNLGKGFADRFQSSLIEELGWRDRGIKKGNFWILKATSMPAVLVELGFYTNPAERAKMLDAEYQYLMGVALGNVIKEIQFT